MARTTEPYRIFVSSPGDVGEERLVAQKVLARLRVEYGARISLDPIFWEHEPLRATASFQEQITRPSEADVVITILWSRMGTRLPAQLTRADGSPYQSGTEFEFEDAAASHRQRGLPDLLVYRKTTPPVALLDEEVVERLANKRALDAFLDRWFRGADGSFTAAFHPFEKPAQLEELLERHLRKLIEAKLPDGPPSRSFVMPAIWQEGSPFRGLLPFDFEHAAVFSGRTQAIGDVLHGLRQQSALGHPFVLIVGGSGLGKSSLARAGILPALTRPGVIEGIGLWRRAVMRPGAAAPDLCLALAHALAQPDGLPALADGDRALADLADLLRSGSAAVGPILRAQLQLEADRVQQAERLEQRPVARLALLVDQLEEIFTTPHVTAADRKAFVEAVSTLARTGVVWVIATIRSDFYPRCAEIPELLSLKGNGGQYDLRPPSAIEIGQLIRFPARLAGLDFEEHGETGERLDEVLRDAAVAEPEALPLLQFALEELYRRRRDHLLTFASYADLGGLQGAVANRAEEVFGALPPEAQEELGSCFGALVTVDVTKDDVLVSKPAPLDMLRRTPARAALVDRFIEARLLMADRSEGGPPTVRVAHDALLKLWPRLRDWIASNTAMLRLRALLTTSAVIWHAQGGKASFLLPTGDVLTHATRLLRDSPEELTPGEVDYVTRSLAAATRVRRRRIAIRVLEAAAAVLLLVAAIVYWDSYHRERVEYYSSSVLRWALPEGIGAVPADAWKTRYETVRITRTGRLGPIELEVLDEHGACKSPDFAATGSYDIDAESLDGMFTEAYMMAETKPDPCRWRFNRRWNGAVDTVHAFDPANALLYRVRYEPDRIDRASFVNEKGYVHARFTTGAGVVEFSYLSTGPHAGLIDGVRYFDAYGQPQADANGGCGVRVAYDPRGRLHRFKLLNCKWEPMLMKVGMAGVQIDYDARGYYTRASMLGLDDRPVTTRDFGAHMRIERDDRGRMIGLNLLNTEHGPHVSPRLGVARIVVGLDDHGRTVDVACLDGAGKPATCLFIGCARLLSAYDSHGSATRLECRGPDGALHAAKILQSFAKYELVNDADGKPIEIKQFDERDRLRFWRFQDAAGNLRKDDRYQFAQHYAQYEDERDAGGQMRHYATLRWEDAKEQELYTMSRLDDAEGRELVAAHTRDDKPVTVDGYYRRESSYTASGNLEETRYFDANAQPCLSSNGYAHVKFTYDEKGRVRRRQHFDLDSREVPTVAMITAVDPDSPAATSGLKPGDIVLRYHDEAIEHADQLSALTRAPGKGTRPMIVTRAGQQLSLDVPPGRLGITIDQRAAGLNHKLSSSTRR